MICISFQRKLNKNRGLEFFKIKSERLPQISDISLLIYMLNKNTWGVKKCEANQKQHASRQVRPKALISAEAKKLLYQITFNSLNDIQ